MLERVLPTRGVLAQRLYAHSQELADARRHLSRYHELVVAARRAPRRAGRGGADPRWRDLRALSSRALAEVLATESADALTIMDDMLKVVSAHVTVRPSGHEFFVDGRDTLLQAGLKAGLKLNYGCGNGTCGLCKARVVSGEVVKVDAVRLSAVRSGAPAGLHAAVRALGGVRRHRDRDARGARPRRDPRAGDRGAGAARRSRSRRTRCCCTCRRRARNRLRFLAGQSATLYGGAGGVDAQRAYPIASCPCDDRNLHFHVARDPGDALARRCCSRGAIRSGDPLTLWGPTGEFVLAESERPLAFVACDTGFAPIKSLIEHAMAVEANRSISVDWLATTPDGHYLANQCRAWAAAYDDFRFAPHGLADPVAGAQAAVAALAAAVRLPERDVYVAGPAAFVDAAKAALAETGATATRIFALVV